MVTDTSGAQWIARKKFDCPKCTRPIRLTLKGEIPKHKVRRGYRSQHYTLDECPFSGRKFEKVGDL